IICYDNFSAFVVEFNVVAFYSLHLRKPLVDNHRTMLTVHALKRKIESFFIIYCHIVYYYYNNKIDNKRLDRRYTILEKSCKIYSLYTSSKGFLLSVFICLKWLGESPVTFLNWLLRYATLE